MFACLYLPPRAKSLSHAVRAESRGLRAESSRLRADSSRLTALARDFSPRIETHADHIVTLDIDGLDRLLGDARAIGDQLRRSAADLGLPVHVAIASTTAAAILLAHSRAGLTVVPPGG